MKKKNVIKIGFCLGALILILTSSISMAATRNLSKSSQLINDYKDSSTDSSVELESSEKTGNCRMICSPAIGHDICYWDCD
jgi:hypothetical protein